jgi:ketosteroid isomerase-like protein
MATASPELTQVLRSMDEEFVRRFNAKDADRLADGYWSDDARLLPPNHPQVDGLSAIRDFIQGMFDAGFGDLTLDTRQIETSGELTYGIGRYTMALRPPAGEPVRDQGKYLVVYRRQPDGGWRVIADMFNSDQAAG